MKIGFIGGGNMAASLIGGLVPATVAAADVLVFEPNADTAKNLARAYKITIADNNLQLVASCDVIVVAVKPQVLHGILSPLRDAFVQHQPLIVSIVAGIRSDSIQQWLGGKQSIIRAMPNTPALVSAGASGLYANAYVSDKQKQIADTLLDSVGSTVWVENEADIDAVTALSGSGPAYFMLFIQALVDSAIKAGLDPHAAKQLAVDTAAGAAQLIRHSEDPLDVLIDKVTSPGGTTEQALKTMRDANLPEILADAFESARIRSEQLAAELGKS